MVATSLMGLAVIGGLFLVGVILIAAILRR